MALVIFIPHLVVERNSVCILLAKRKKKKEFQSPGWLKLQQIDSAKVQRWSFMFWGLFRVPLILQLSVVRGEWRTCSLQMWLYLFLLGWHILNSAVSPADGRRHVLRLRLCVVGGRILAFVESKQTATTCNRSEQDVLISRPCRIYMSQVSACWVNQSLSDSIAWRCDCHVTTGADVMSSSLYTSTKHLTFRSLSYRLWLLFFPECCLVCFSAPTWSR